MCVEKLVYENKTIEIYYDEPGGANPRDWDNLGHMVCFHKRYDLGDAHQYHEDEFSSWDALAAQIRRDEDVAVILPVYMMDHSGLRLSVSAGGFAAVDSMRWDWGQVGFIYATKQEVLSNFMCGKMSKRLRTLTSESLAAEVEVYSSYIQGEVYRWEIAGNDHECVDGVGGDGGYYSVGEAIADAKDAVDRRVNEENSALSAFSTATNAPCARP